MPDFTEEYANTLLSKEWLIKVDNERSTPYLFKFCSSTTDFSCCVIVTDTRLVWAEVLSNKQFARRWRSCNHASDPEIVNYEDANTWGTQSLELLSRVHTLGGIAEVSFRLFESDYSLECGTFVWRWETNYLGHKQSSDIISKHLILPLISLGHMAVSSNESISEMSDTDIEKAVDRMGRTARRTVDTHLKHALSKPRMATTVQRITAMFNFASDLPTIFSEAEAPSLEFEARSKTSKFLTPNRHPVISVQDPSRQSPSLRKKGSQEVQVDSATESEPDVSPDKGDAHAQVKASPGRPPGSPGGSSASLSSATPPVVLVQTTQPASTIERDSESETSPVRPIKKHKGPSSTEEDGNGEAGRSKTLQQVKTESRGPVAKRTVRQPIIKRTAKRF